MERRDEQSIEAVKLYYQQGLSQAEVATRMGLSRPTVAKLLAHGREREGVGGMTHVAIRRSGQVPLGPGDGLGAVGGAW